MEIIGYFGIGNPAGKYDLTSDPQLLRHIFKRLFPGSIPDYKNSEAVPHHVPETGGSPQQEIEIFLLFQACSRSKQPFFSVQIPGTDLFLAVRISFKSSCADSCWKDFHRSRNSLFHQTFLHGRGRYEYRVTLIRKCGQILRYEHFPAEARRVSHRLPPRCHPFIQFKIMKIFFVTGMIRICQRNSVFFT